MKDQNWCYTEKLHGSDFVGKLLSNVSDNGFVVENMNKKYYDNYMKEDSLKRSIIGAEPGSDYIWRIFDSKYLLEDLENQTLTLVRPSQETQNDPLENPLIKTFFPFEKKCHRLFKNLVKNFYCQSWSQNEIPWEEITTKSPAVRVKCRWHAIFDRLVNIEDKYYDFNYRLINVTYKDKTHIENGLRDLPMEYYIDDQLLSILCTIGELNSDFQSEEEIRLVYIRRPQEDNPFPNRNILKGKKNEFCAHLFNWDGIIESFEFEKNPNDNEVLKLKKKLEALVNNRSKEHA